jgi:hypothetical protein
VPNIYKYLTSREYVTDFFLHDTFIPKSLILP